MRHTRFGFFAALTAAVGCGNPLPELPVSGENEPNSIEWVSLAGLDDAAIEPTAFPAGSVARVQFRVLDQAGEPATGAALNLTAQAEDFADLLRFPSGNDCFVDAQGLCELVLASKGGAGRLTLTARVSAAAPLVTEYDLVVVARQDQLRLHVEVQGLGSVSFDGQGTDPLDALDRVLLNADVDTARLVTLAVSDRFNNPVADQATQLSLVTAQQVRLDAGASGEDSGVILDASALVDTGLVVADSGAVDTRPPAGDSGVAGDAGAIGTEPQLSVQVSATADCSQAVEPQAPGAAVTDDEGRVYYCLRTTAYRGDWRALLRVPSVVTEALEPHGEAALALDGRTSAGVPTQISALIDGDAVQCYAGHLSAAIRFRVINSVGDGVPGVRVFFAESGGLNGVSTSLAETNSLGEVSVRASCPTNSIGEAFVEARVTQPLLEPARVPIEMRADDVSELEIIADANNPEVVRDGDQLRFRVVASDINGLRVLRARDSSEPLRLQLGIVSSGHARTLWLAEDPLLSQQLAVDGSGDLHLTLTVRSRATVDQPIRFEVSTLDRAVRAQQAIAVSPGAPSHLEVQPAGRVQALVGGVGGMIRMRVLDGPDVNTANGVPNALVRVVAPVDLVLDRTDGVTDAAGRFEAMIVRVDRLGEHTLTLHVSHGEWSAQTELVVEGTAGVAQAIEVRLNDRRLELTGAEGQQAAYEVSLGASERLSDTLSLRLTNDQGGGIPGLGLSIELLEGAQGDCANWADSGVTDEAGEVRYGEGLLALTGGPRLERCLYRIRHGATPASIMVRVVQVAGRPLTASLERLGGLAPPLENQLEGPADYSPQNAAQLELVARDANNNPATGQAMYVVTNNCLVSARRVTLDERGSARLFATTGADPDASCRVVARYERSLPGYEAPALELASAGFGAPVLDNIVYTLDSSYEVMLSPNRTHKWRLYGRNMVVDPNLANNVPCADFSLCTSVQVVELGAANEQGIRPVRRVLHEGLPIAYDTQVAGGTFVVSVPHAAMGAGGWLGLRLVANRALGEPLRIGSAVPFYAQPPGSFVGVGPGGLRGQVTVTPPADNPNGAVELFGGQRINLDDDEALELVVCGSDELGKLFAVIDTVDGALPEQAPQAQRASRFGGDWLGLGGNAEYLRSQSSYQVDGAHEATARPKDACVLADLNEDGRLDLVVPGRTETGAVSNGYPHVTVHNGVPGGFGVGQPVAWAAPSVRNRQIRNLALSAAPPGVVVCVERLQNNRRYDVHGGDDTDRACLERLFLPLEQQAGSWSPLVRSADVLSAAAPEGRLRLVEPPRLMAMEQGGWIYKSGAWITWEVRGARRVQATDETITDLVYSPDGSTLAWASGRELGLVDTGTEQTRRGIFPDISVIQDLAFSADSQRLAVSAGNRLSIYNVELGALERSLFGHRSNISAVAYSPDGQIIASGDSQGALRLWSAQTGDPVASRALHGAGITSLAFSGDGRWLASASSDGTLRLVDAQTGLGERVLRDDLSVTSSSVFSPDSRSLYVGGVGRTWMMDVASGVTMYTTNNGPSSNLVMSPTGRTLVRDLEGVAISTFLTPGLSELLRFDGHSVVRATDSTIAMHPAGQAFVSSGSNGDLKYWTLSEVPSRATLSMSYGRYNYRDFTPLGGQAEPGSVWSDRAGFLQNRVALERPITWRPYCGNGVLDEGELFDDGQPFEPSTEYHINCGATCGDGFVHQGEGCDDGNNAGGDGCSRLCQTE